MRRVDSMSRFAEPGNEPEAYECEKCGEIKDSKEFRNDHARMCAECEEENEETK
jgi:hypothetical protein